MLNNKSAIFVHFLTDAKERVLHPATVLEVIHNTACHTAELEDDNLYPQSGDEIFIYFEVHKQFMAQAARIEFVMHSDDNPLITFVTSSDAIPADHRQSFRVSTATRDITAHIGTEKCHLLDAGATGFSVVSLAPYGIGAIVDATIIFEDNQFTGTARIHSTRAMSYGRIRYGLQCFNEMFRNGDNLYRGLQHITMAVQRQQLRRLSRSG